MRKYDGVKFFAVFFPVAPKLIVDWKRSMDFKEILSVLADVATIITAILATGIFLKINVVVSDNGNKTAKQTAMGSDNKQSVKQ